MDFSNGCIQATNCPATRVGLLSVSDSWNDITAASGSNPGQGADGLFTLPFPENTAPQAHLHILLVEDKADMLIVREALEAAELLVDLYVVSDGENGDQIYRRVECK